MTVILKQIFSIIKLLNSETGHNQIAAGISAGFILGMTPSFSLQSLLVFFCIFFFRIQAGMAFLSAFFFAFIAWALDPLFHTIGSFFLEMPILQSTWTKLYNIPIVPWTRFNNSIVLGSAIISICLSPFLFFLSKSLVFRYREAVVERFKNSRAWKALRATTIIKWYYSYEDLYGNR